MLNLDEDGYKFLKVHKEKLPAFDGVTSLELQGQFMKPFGSQGLSKMRVIKETGQNERMEFLEIFASTSAVCRKEI